MTSQRPKWSGKAEGWLQASCGWAAAGLRGNGADIAVPAEHKEAPAISVRMTGLDSARIKRVQRVSVWEWR